ncbi:ABC transporter ATP-binding protein [Actinopolyspora saharensis]|uniref:ABC transporter ATP-binding protein n=1 Tax=Actinopolyspora saharensis TaxID=995062 RepID=UPI003F674B35
MQDMAIEVSELCCSYDDFEAVRGLNFGVERGELFALLGTNGAGKTTTMETIEGHRAPTSGAVRVLGKDPVEQRVAVRKQCGIMLQESGFAGDLTVLETVQLWQKMVSRDSDADTALERLALANRRDVRVKQLSGGEKRRLDLTLATLGEPELLFLDEPTTGLDPESRKETWQVIQDLLAEGTTVLLTTHYLEEAEKLAHRLAIMHQGRIAVSGSLVDVLERERAEISFDLPSGIEPTPGLPATSGEVDQERLTTGRVHIRTDDLQRDMSEVVRWANSQNLALGRFRAHHASLEDVFHSVLHRDQPLPGISATDGQDEHRKRIVK